MPTADALLKAARTALSETETPALDARLLLQAAAQLSPEQLVADPTVLISDEDAKRFQDFVNRRARFEPVSRILGARDFFGRTFHVTPDVLDPRADTETIVEACLARMNQHKAYRILDLGTGSGILAITLLAERLHATCVAVDVSDTALSIARKNAEQLGVQDRLACHQGSWFAPVEGRFDVIVSNPPYIPAADILSLDEEVKDFDPHLALAGGDDGLECYRAIAAGAREHLIPHGYVALEIGAGQAKEVTSIFATQGFTLASQHPDLGGHVRCLVLQAIVNHL
jgi:release factor glutamine methyltransferase